nr:hypothetical protein [Angustibacter aerolatus]
MTLISFIVTRPPADSGVAITLRCATVSTSSCAITRAITGLRMSARTNVASPIGCGGGTTSTPTTRSTSGQSLSTSQNRPPR